MTASEPESGKDIQARGAASPLLEATGGTGFVGGTVDVDVTLAGLPSASSPALGAYDIRVSFDSSQLTFQSVIFSDSLGDEGAGEVITQNPSGMGFLDGVAVSLLAPATLVAQQQGDPLPLFTVRFQAQSTGTFPVGLSLNASLGDENGEPLEAVAADGEVQVNAAPPMQQIPTLSQWGLIALMLFLASAGLRRLTGRRAEQEGL